MVVRMPVDNAMNAFSYFGKQASCVNVMIMVGYRQQCRMIPYIGMTHAEYRYVMQLMLVVIFQKMVDKNLYSSAL